MLEQCSFNCMRDLLSTQAVRFSRNQQVILRTHANHELHSMSNPALPRPAMQVPTTVKSKAGRSHELLSNGAEACVFNIIPGTLAKTTSPEEVGQAPCAFSGGKELGEWGCLFLRTVRDSSGAPAMGPLLGPAHSIFRCCLQPVLLCTCAQPLGTQPIG